MGTSSSGINMNIKITNK